MLAVTFVRSPHAHARVVRHRRDGGAARCRAWRRSSPPPICAASRGRWRPRMLGEGFTPTEWPPLADGEVRFCGQAVAVVAAETPYLAADARELVRVEYEPRPARGHDRRRAGRGARALPPRATPRRRRRRLRRAPRIVLRERFTHGRCAAAPLEPRGVIADWDGESLTVWASTQTPSMLADGAGRGARPRRDARAGRRPRRGRRLRPQDARVPRGRRGGGAGAPARPPGEVGRGAAREPHAPPPTPASSAWTSSWRPTPTGVVRGLRARAVSDGGAHHIYPADGRAGAARQRDHPARALSRRGLRVRGAGRADTTSRRSAPTAASA